MSLASILGSIGGMSAPTGVARNGLANATGDAMGAAVETASLQSELEIGAAQLSKIKSDKSAKIRELTLEASKNRMAVNAKGAATIQF